MSKSLAAACVLCAATVAVGPFRPLILLGQEERPPKEWRFDQAQPDWKPTLPLPASTAVELERTTDALRVSLVPGSGTPAGLLLGGIYTDLPDWRREEWADVVVRARTTSTVNLMIIGLNRVAGAPTPDARQATFQSRGGVTPVVRDGVVRTYRIHLDWGGQSASPWQRVGLLFQAPEPGSIDILSVRVVPAASGPAPSPVMETTLEPPQLKSDLALLREALEEAHAGLYRWTSKRDMDAEFARAEANLSQPTTILEFRSVLLRVVAAIKCGHTLFNNYSGDEISAVLNAARLFPLALQFEANRAVVVLNQGQDERAKPGMEVLAINGEPLETILQSIIPYVSHDGYIPTNRRYVLGVSWGFHRQWSPGRTGFSEAYRLYIGNPATFATTLREPRSRKTVTLELPGVTNAEAAVNAERNPVNRAVLKGMRILQALGETQSIRYLDGESTAILRLPGFRRFGDFLAASFAELSRRGTKNLIIDLRGNSGGRDDSVPLLFSYLAAQEFRVYERIHMTPYQPTFRQYTDNDFTPAAGFPEFSPDSGFLKPDPDGGWLLTERKSGNHTYQPADNRFQGAVYILIDGGSFSATADFAATAAFHQRATFIGEETGGVAEGNNSGVEIGLTLPESHLHLGIPIYAYVNAVDKGNHGRGTIPAHIVTQRIDYLARGRDTALELARALIRAAKAQ